MVSGYKMNVSCIKAIKSTYSAYRGSKTVRKKGMNEFLEAEKEACACEVARRVVESTKEHSVRKSCQAVAKRARPSPSASDSSQKKARRKPEVEVSLQKTSQPGLGFVESKEEKDVAPSLIWSWRSRGLTTLEGIEVVEGPQSEAPVSFFNDLKRRS